MEASQIEFGARCRAADGFEGTIKGKTEYDNGTFDLILRNELSGPPDAPHLEERVVHLAEVELVDP